MKILLLIVLFGLRACMVDTNVQHTPFLLQANEVWLGVYQA